MGKGCLAAFVGFVAVVSAAAAFGCAVAVDWDARAEILRVWAVFAIASGALALLVAGLAALFRRSGHYGKLFLVGCALVLLAFVLFRAF